MSDENRHKTPAKLHSASPHRGSALEAAMNGRTSGWREVPGAIIPLEKLFCSNNYYYFFPGPDKCTVAASVIRLVIPVLCRIYSKSPLPFYFLCSSHLITYPRQISSTLPEFFPVFFLQCFIFHWSTTFAILS